MVTRSTSKAEFERVVQQVLGYSARSNVWSALTQDLQVTDFVDFVGLSDEDIEGCLLYTSPSPRDA